MTTVTQDGKEREMYCMPVRKLPAWLASINPKKVKPELCEKIERYQAECEDTLWAYWINDRVERKIEKGRKAARARWERSELLQGKSCLFRLSLKGLEEDDRYYRYLEKAEDYRLYTIA